MTKEERALREELYDYGVYENYDSYYIEKRIYKVQVFEVTADMKFPEPRRYMFTHWIDKQTLRAMYEHKLIKGLRDTYEREIFLSIED